MAAGVFASLVICYLTLSTHNINEQRNIKTIVTVTIIDLLAFVVVLDGQA